MVYQGPCCMYHCSTYNVLIYQILNYTWSSLWFLKNGEGLGKCKYILILQWSSAFHSIIIYIAFYCIIAMYCMYCLMYLVKSLIRGLIFHQILQQWPITFWSKITTASQKSRIICWVLVSVLVAKYAKQYFKSEITHLTRSTNACVARSSFFSKFKLFMLLSPK